MGKAPNTLLYSTTSFLEKKTLLGIQLRLFYYSFNLFYNYCNWSAPKLVLQAKTIFKKNIFCSSFSSVNFYYFSLSRVIKIFWFCSVGGIIISQHNWMSSDWLFCLSHCPKGIDIQFSNWLPIGYLRIHLILHLHYLVPLVSPSCYC